MPISLRQTSLTATLEYARQERSFLMMQLQLLRRTEIMA